MFRLKSVFLQSYRPMTLKPMVNFEPKNNYAVISMDRMSAMNALNTAMINELGSVLVQIQRNLDSDNSVRCILLRSSLPSVFSVGADLKERLKMSADDVKEFLQKLRSVILKIFHAPIPTIACLDGDAYGGGLEIALACDMRIAASNVRFGLSETKLGVIPGAGGTQFLSRQIPAHLAKEWIFSGRILDAAVIQQIDFVNRVVEQNEHGNAAFLEAEKLAEEIAANTAPLAIKMAKKAINSSYFPSIDEALQTEFKCYEKLLHTKDRLEGLQAFAEKRKACFKGE